MALVVKDRVRESSTTIGTGTITLNGPVSGFQSFLAIGDGNTTYYTIVDGATGDWEVGIGTYTAAGTTLSRDTVLESSTGGALVDFVAGTRDVFCTYPAERSVYTDAAGSVITPATASTLPVSSGGTGATTLTGVVKGTGTSALTAGAVNLASEVSGTLPVANGGTGLTSTPTNGQIDIGNGTGFTRTTLTAGSGINISNGAGSISIAATNTGTVTSVGGTGTVNGITLSGTVTSSGNLTLGGTLSGVDLATQVTGTLPVGNGGTGATTFASNNVLLGNGAGSFQVVAPGTSGNVLTSNGTTWVSSVAPAGGVDYVFKTANYTTQNNEGVLADTSGGAFTVTLPATPAVGDQCIVADAGGLFGTNNLTVGRNGSTISGLAEDLVLDINGVSVQFVYDGTTWEVYAQVGGNGGTAVTLNGVQTLTNKTISADNNTISGIAASSFVLSNGSGNIDGTAAQKAIPTGDVVGTSDSQALTNKTIAFGSNTLTDVASTNTTQTLTNKTLTDPAIIGAITEDIFTITDDAAFEIDPGNGTIQLITLGASRTPKATNFTAGESVTLMVDDGSAYTLTWTDTTFGASGVIWKTDGGNAPTLNTTGYTVITFWKVGTQVYGARVGNA